MNQRVSLLVLANLGLAGLMACSKEPVPPVGVTAEPSVQPAQPAQPAQAAQEPLVIPPMTASVASAPPPAPRTPPEPSAAASATAPGISSTPSTVGIRPPHTGGHVGEVPDEGKKCKTDKDCAQRCWIPTDKTEGTCGHYPSRGRPLFVEGDAHIAEYTQPFMPRVTSEEIARLHEAAREEHASIAAFARTIAELMALGAPTSLLAETGAALADEIRHTERSLDILAKLTGERPVVGRLEAAVAPLARPIEDFFRDVFHGGAVGETMAAAEAETRRLATTDDEVRAFYEMIVVDESRHAALAFKTLRWLLEREPALATVLTAERASLRGEQKLLVGPLFDSIRLA